MPKQIPLSAAKELAKDLGSRVQSNATIQRFLGGLPKLPDALSQAVKGADNIPGEQKGLGTGEQKGLGRIRYDPVAEVPLDRIYSVKNYRQSPLADQLRLARAFFREIKLKEGQQGAVLRQALRTAGMPSDAVRAVLNLEGAVPLPTVGGLDLDLRIDPGDIVVWDPQLNRFRPANYVRGRMGAITDASQNTASDWTDLSPLAAIVGNDPRRILQMSRLMAGFSPGTSSSLNPVQALEVYARQLLEKRGLSPQATDQLMRKGTMGSYAPMYPVEAAKRVSRALNSQPFSSLKIEDLVGTTMSDPRGAALDLRNWGRIMGSASEVTPGELPYRLASEAQDTFYDEVGLPTSEGFARNWNYLQQVENNPTLSYNESLLALPLDFPLIDPRGRVDREAAQYVVDSLPAFKDYISDALVQKKQTGIAPQLWTPDQASPSVRGAVLNLLGQQRQQDGWSKYVTDPAQRGRQARQFMDKFRE